ncbi:hypothetical protein [Falsiroseomonas sp. CW058]|uniref:hypothetical protein n=1 Tax=Falsiroseomonas sp. CW058 TaxID=3388664 RepID=UPI003D3220DF
MPRTTKSVAAPAPATRHVIRDRAVAQKAEAYATAKADIKRLEAQCDALKPELLAAMGDHESVVAGNRVLTRSAVAGTDPTPNVTITKAMIGQVIPGKPGKRGYTQLTVQ